MRGGFPDTDKYLLANVFRFRRIAKHLRRRADHAVLMPRHQHFEGFEIAGLNAKHERNILLALIDAR